METVVPTDNDDIGPPLRSYAISCIVVVTIIASLRFWSRYVCSERNGKSFWWDDWMALAAWPCCMTQWALVITLVSIGLGRHNADLSPAQIAPSMPLVFGFDTVFVLSMALTRSSALFFYTRIFLTTVHSRFRFVLRAIQALNLAVFITLVLLQTLNCNPPAKSFDPSIPGVCISNQLVWVLNATTSVLMDLLVLFAPLPMVLRLDLKLSKKLLVTAVLACGALAFVASLGRLITSTAQGDLVDNPDNFYTVVPTYYWAVSEAAIALISVCLPTIFHLVKRAIRLGPRTLVSRQSEVYRPGGGNDTFGTRGKSKMPLSLSIISEAGPQYEGRDLTEGVRLWALESWDPERNKSEDHESLEIGEMAPVHLAEKKVGEVV